VDSSRDRVDVATAAVRLGITPDGIRKRIKRGQLVAYQADGRTWVVLDNETDKHDSADGHDTTRHDGRQDTNAMASNLVEGLDQVSPALVARLEDENRYLRAQLDAMHERLREAHLLLAQRPALPEPGGVAVSDADLTAEPATKPWWTRWWPWGRL
jgi:hypothetical protein